MAPRHDAFVSYSHAADGKLAAALERGLEKIAKPLLKLRAIEFRSGDALIAARRFNSGATEGVVELHRWQAADMLAEACRRMPLAAAAGQWKQLLPGQPVPSPCNKTSSASVR